MYPTYDAPGEEYRLILVEHGSGMIWATIGDGSPRLARISIQSGGRPVQQLQHTIRSKLFSRAIILETDVPSVSHSRSAVIEIWPPAKCRGPMPVRIEDLCEEEAIDVRRWTQTLSDNEAAARRSFSRPGWIDEAKEWIEAAIGPEDCLTGEVEQYNATGQFCLAHFKAHDGPGFWLKATGAPNCHEFGITALLANRYSDSLPRLVATRADWNAWLMMDGGTPLSSWTSSTVSSAIRQMVSLQTRTIGKTDELLHAGAFDQRTGAVRARIPELIAYLTEAMGNQVSTKAPRMERSRLNEMAKILDDACGSMERLAIPDTLMHGDLNPSNVLFRGGNCVFTDWCEAAVGNPFVTLFHIHLLGCSVEGAWARPLPDLCRNSWLELLEPIQTLRALALIPLLAPFAYLCGRGAWLCSNRRFDPQIQSFARALARRMDRASRDPKLREALCH